LTCCYSSAKPKTQLLSPTPDAVTSRIRLLSSRDYYPGVLPGQVENLLGAARTVTPDAIRDVVREFEDIGCDEFIFVPVKPNIAQLDGLAEIVC
jgi:hypothetical protein